MPAGQPNHEATDAESRMDEIRLKQMLGRALTDQELMCLQTRRTASAAEAVPTHTALSVHSPKTHPPSVRRRGGRQSPPIWSSGCNGEAEPSNAPQAADSTLPRGAGRAWRAAAWADVERAPRSAGQNESLRLRGIGRDYSPDALGTTSTGRSARWMTAAETDPSNAPATAPSPRVPITITGASRRRASSAI